MGPEPEERGLHQMQSETLWNREYKVKYSFLKKESTLRPYTVPTRVSKELGSSNEKGTGLTEMWFKPNSTG
jgi:hypothetical protein